MVALERDPGTHPAAAMIAFVVIFLLTAGAASFGALFPPGPWYAALAKPALTPPDWAFPTVWSALYVMIACAGWMLWLRRGVHPRGHLAVTAWGAQLVLNGLWSWLFFGCHLTGVALVELMFLWATILATILLARRHAPGAAWLLLPYSVWVAFAGWLNFGIWRLNG